TGSKILKMCDGNHSINEIVDILYKSFEQVDYETIRRDVWKFIKKLNEFGIVEWKEQSSKH
ncbi:MAG TPA: PqqD family protein, partial [Candidatus Atribacteria bacterium]|nr:PqqD family protein [Candidatus Atribacteria bacterium]